MNKSGAVPITAKTLLMTQRDSLKDWLGKNVAEIIRLQGEIHEIRVDIEVQERAINDIEGALSELGKSRF